jgi:threonine synthase
MKDFAGISAQMPQAHDEIKKVWEDEHYLIDTHTAVASSALGIYRENTGDMTPSTVVSTASAYKFADKVTKVLGLKEGKDGFEDIEILKEYTQVPVPSGLKDLDKKPVTQSGVIDKDEMKEAVTKAIK